MAKNKATTTGTLPKYPAPTYPTTTTTLKSVIPASANTSNGGGAGAGGGKSLMDQLTDVYLKLPQGKKFAAKPNTSRMDSPLDIGGGFNMLGDAVFGNGLLNDSEFDADRKGARQVLKRQVTAIKDNTGLRQREAVSALMEQFKKQQANTATYGLKGKDAKQVQKIIAQQQGGLTADSPDVQMEAFQKFFTEFLNPYIQQQQDLMNRSADAYEEQMVQTIPLMRPERQQIAMMYLPQMLNNMRQQAAMFPQTVISTTLPQLLMSSGNRENALNDWINFRQYGQNIPGAASTQEDSVDQFLLAAMGGNEDE